MQRQFVFKEPSRLVFGQPESMRRSRADCTMVCAFRVTLALPATDSLMKAPEPCFNSMIPSC